MAETDWTIVWTMVGTGLVIIGIVAGAFTSLRSEMRELRREMIDGHNSLRGEIGSVRDEVSREIGSLRDRMSRLEGLLDGLREALTLRSAV